MGIYSSPSSSHSQSPKTSSSEHMGTYIPAQATKASEDRLWTSRAPVSPPMTNYAPSVGTGMSSVRTSEDSRPKPRDNSTAAAIQRLPSLNSLFGRPPSQIRPPLPPLSERPSPLGAPSRSPLDHPHSATSSQRSLSTSYFPSTVAPRSSYAASATRSDHDRNSAGYLQFPGPLSPGRTRDSISHRQHDGRHDSLSTVSSTRWSYSNQSEPRRPDYILSNNESAPTYRVGADRLPYPTAGPRLSYEANNAGYREHANAPPLQHSQVERPQAPRDLPGTPVSEGVPVKDGLGPKIWTGTHFLPRFLRQSEVPGEGLCYFYDDGTHCKAIIDGEQVNAHWGVTKAGKPRKRLAIACLTCREKKIKCDPDFPRCVQCEKFGRVCRFKNAPRGGHNTSPGASPTHENEEIQQSVETQSLNDATRRRSTISSSSVSPRTNTLKRVASSAGMGEHQTGKRLAVEYERYAPPTHHLSPVMQNRELPKVNLPWPSREDAQSDTRSESHRELPLSNNIRHRPW